MDQNSSWLNAIIRQLNSIMKGSAVIFGGCFKWNDYQTTKKLWRGCYLAAKRAVDIRFLEAPVTGSTIVSRPFKLPILRSFLDEHHFCAINSIGLNEISAMSEGYILKTTSVKMQRENSENGILQVAPTWTLEQSMSFSRSSNLTTSWYT